MYQLCFNHGFLVGDILILSIDGAECCWYRITCDNFLKPIKNIEKEKSNIHPNKQRAQSKINGKNSRWC